jgi:hypothetical protein
LWRIASGGWGKSLTKAAGTKATTKTEKNNEEHAERQKERTIQPHLYQNYSLCKTWKS